MGCRCGRMRIPVASRSRFVTAAANASGRIGSGIGTFSGPGIRPDGSYGYADRYPTGMTTCSTVQIDSIPTSSAVRARCASGSGNPKGPALAYAIPNFMAAAILDPHRRHKAGRVVTGTRGRYTGAMNRLVGVGVAAVVATLLWLNLDSGRLTSEPASRFFSMPLVGLSAIFGVRAWTESQ